MNKFTTIVALLICGISYAQNEISTLNVKGKASLNIRPTQTVITFSLSESKTNYEECIEELSSRVYLLSTALQKSGFKQQEIKTSNFDIRKHIVYEKGQTVDKGFVASQTVRITFKQTKEQLLKILNESAGSKANASIQINFELNDTDKKHFQDELIKLAVADAHSKAEIIVNASGYIIAGIKNINYITNNDYRPPVALRNMASMESSSEIQAFEVADLLLSEQIDIEFIIKKIK